MYQERAFSPLFLICTLIYLLNIDSIDNFKETYKFYRFYIKTIIYLNFH